MENNERVELLADYLNIEPSDIEESYRDNEFETPLGDYLVLTEDEAYEMEKEYIIDLLDDIGYEGLNVNLNDFVTDDSWFENEFRQYYRSYIEDIEYEDDDVFENRFIEECYEDANLLFDEDFEKDENGNIDFKHLKETVDIDDLKEKYLDFLTTDSISDYIEEFRYQFGEDMFSEVVKRNNLIDNDALADFCIRSDGLGHNIASYDGKEIYLDKGFSAYRTN